MSYEIPKSDCYNCKYCYRAINYYYCRKRNEPVRDGHLKCEDYDVQNI